MKNCQIMKRVRNFSRESAVCCRGRCKGCREKPSTASANRRRVRKIQWDDGRSCHSLVRIECRVRRTARRWRKPERYFVKLYGFLEEQVVGKRIILLRSCDRTGSRICSRRLGISLPGRHGHQYPTVAYTGRQKKQAGRERPLRRQQPRNQHWLLWFSRLLQTALLEVRSHRSHFGRWSRDVGVFLANLEFKALERIEVELSGGRDFSVWEFREFWVFAYAGIAENWNIRQL